MASATLVPYNANGAQTTFTLVSTSEQKSVYRVASLDLATPYSLEIQRKLTPVGAKGNDVVSVKIQRVERNTGTNLLCAGSVKVEISIPKDTVALTKAKSLEMLGVLSSLLNDVSNLAATSVNRTALVEGRDL